MEERAFAVPPDLLLDRRKLIKRDLLQIPAVRYGDHLDLIFRL